MTHDEYNACRLPKRLTFREREAALLVLVHGFTHDQAAYCVKLDNPAGLASIAAAVKMFEIAHAENK